MAVMRCIERMDGGCMKTAMRGLIFVVLVAVYPRGYVMHDFKIGI